MAIPESPNQKLLRELNVLLDAQCRWPVFEHKKPSHWELKTLPVREVLGLTLSDDDDISPFEELFETIASDYGESAHKDFKQFKNTHPNADLGDSGENGYTIEDYFNKGHGQRDLLRAVDEQMEEIISTSKNKREIDEAMKQQDSARTKLAQLPSWKDSVYAAIDASSNLPDQKKELKAIADQYAVEYDELESILGLFDSLTGRLKRVKDLEAMGAPTIILVAELRKLPEWLKKWMDKNMHLIYAGDDRIQQKAGEFLPEALGTFAGLIQRFDDIVTPFVEAHNPLRQ